MRSFSIDKYDVIVFDCDGVIIDINENKVRAFEEAVKKYPLNIVQDFSNFCRNSFGTSRYEKFKCFFSDFANAPFNQEEYEEMLNTYSSICRADYITSDLTVNCLEALLISRSLEKKMFIASGSDEQELRDVFKFRKLNFLFEKIYGSPNSKKIAIQSILNDYEYESEKILFVGDAESDLLAAKAFKIDFVYMSKYTIQSKGQDEICRENAVKVISHLKELFV